MSYIEDDPRDMGYVALYIAVKWYQDITPETAIRIANGKSIAMKEIKPTAETYQEIKKVILNPNFKDITHVCRRFRINKYKIYKMLSKERYGKVENTGEEILKMAQVENILKKLKDIAENCAGDCNKCSLDTVIYKDITLCELLCDIEFDDKNRIIKSKVRQVSDKCPTVKDLQGPVIKKSYRLHEVAVSELDSYIKNNQNKKVQDVVSLALLEYISKRRTKK